MKPVGLVDPRTGRQPFAVVQLRAENREGTLYNLVGFQTKLKYGEQTRVFRLIPGLDQAEFVRLGSIHRNTFIHSPGILSAYLNFLHYPQVFLAGVAQGKAQAAIEQFKLQKRPVPGGHGDLGRAFARAGRIEEARAEIERLDERAVQGYGVGYDLAGIYAAMGNMNEACEALHRALTDHSQLIGFLPYDPAMDPIRGQACYQEVVQRSRVPPS